jgi:hypothetical protein
VLRWPRITLAQEYSVNGIAFQATVDAKSSSYAVLLANEVAPLPRIKQRIPRRRNKRVYIPELLFFILITGIAAWPVVSMLARLAWMKIVIYATTTTAASLN